MRGQFYLGLADNPRLRIRVLHMPYKRSDVGFYIILPYDVKVPLVPPRGHARPPLLYLTACLACSTRSTTSTT